MWEYISRNISCNPPWLSPNNQCTTFFKNLSIYQFLADDFQAKIVDPLYEYRKDFAEQKCKRPCTVYKIEVNMRGRGARKFQEFGVFLQFDQNVAKKVKKMAYTPFQFVIDIGSSLGLWIGMSVLGLLDFLIDSFGIVSKNILK